MSKLDTLLGPEKSLNTQGRKLCLELSRGPDHMKLSISVHVTTQENQKSMPGLFIYSTQQNISITITVSEP